MQLVSVAPREIWVDEPKFSMELHSLLQLLSQLIFIEKLFCIGENMMFNKSIKTNSNVLINVSA